MHFGMNPWAIFTTWLGHYYGGGFKACLLSRFCQKIIRKGVSLMSTSSQESWF